MHTLTDDELERAPAKLLSDARSGTVTVVTTAGEALLMTLPLEAGAPAPGALLDLAATLYDRELISLGRAAEIAGLAYPDMMDELGRRGIATIRLRPGELERELAAFGP
jgi:predicted HTH domain antitoxin